VIKFMHRALVRSEGVPAGEQLVPELYGCQELPGGQKMMAMELSPSLQVSEGWMTLDHIRYKPYNAKQ
jgi:hypothetical protein